MAGQWQIGIVSSITIAGQLAAPLRNNTIQRMILFQNAGYGICGVELMHYRCLWSFYWDQGIIVKTHWSNDLCEEVSISCSGCWIEEKKAQNNTSIESHRDCIPASYIDSDADTSKFSSQSYLPVCLLYKGLVIR
jgi:hypothetical protein